jgi:Rrf2 family protein
VHIKDISKRQDIPQRYLEQIFHKMKHANILKSVRGPRGGYLLAVDPKKITVGDIIKAVRETTSPVPCVENVGACSRTDECVTRSVWKEAGEVIEKVFNSISIDDLCKKSRRKCVKQHIGDTLDFVI